MFWTNSKVARPSIATISKVISRLSVNSRSFHWSLELALATFPHWQHSPPARACPHPRIHEFVPFDCDFKLRHTLAVDSAASRHPSARLSRHDSHYIFFPADRDSRPSRLRLLSLISLLLIIRISFTRYSANFSSPGNFGKPISTGLSLMNT